MNPRQQLAEDLGSRIPGCAVSTKSGHGSLHVGDRIFAFARTDESAALKLPEARIAELIASGDEMHLLQMGQRTMREWLVVPNIAAPENFKLLHEAMAYALSLPGEKKTRTKRKPAKRAAKRSVAKRSAKKAAAKRATTRKASAKKVGKKKSTRR